MFSIFSNLGPEIPFSLFLMALLGLRAKVWPKASVLIRATPEKVFDLIDLAHNKREDWGRTLTHTELVDAARGLFKKSYTTTLTNGSAKSFSALFSIRSRLKPANLVIQREGLEGRSLNNELLSQHYVITPDGENCRLTVTYEWGPRPLIAQLVARADLWGGAYRLKGLAETGHPVEWPYQLISAGVAVLTGALSLAAFSVVMGWRAAAMLTFALFIHELGHLLAYRLMGQPWGRMIFLPFLGAMAIPRLPFESQGQSVFAALMGPGFSIGLAILCASHILLGGDINRNLALLGLITTALNIFNLIPLEPLDGGVALRSVLTRYMGSAARFGLMAIGLMLAAVGFFLSQIILVIFGGIAILFNIRERKIDVGLTPLTRLQVVITFWGYICMVTAYITMLRYYIGLVVQLQVAG
jgi:Zn-dependent protease